MRTLPFVLASLALSEHVTRVREPLSDADTRRHEESALALKNQEIAPGGLQAYAKFLLALARVAPHHGAVPSQLHRTPTNKAALRDMRKADTCGPLYRDSLDQRRSTSSRRLPPKMAAFDNFGTSSIECLMFAQEEAIRMRQEVTEELLLLGVLRHPTAGGAEVLRKAGLTFEKLREVLDKTIGMGASEYDATSAVPLSFGCKAVLEMSQQHATRAGTKFVETEHMVFAMISDPEYTCAMILKRLNIDVDEVKKMLEQGMDAHRDEAFATVGSQQTRPAQASTETLEKYSTDLTKKAEEGKLDPVIGRSVQVQNAVEILARRKKNNPVLVGEPGVGKTAIAQDLAQRIVDGNVPDFLKGKRIMELDLAGLLAGTKFRGEFEERLQNVINEVVAADRNIILMIDEIHTLVNAGGSEGAMDAGNIMKPKLASGELQVIGATTMDEYRKYIEKDKALERRFSAVDVPEPTVDETIEILKGIVYKYEEYHHLSYTPEALEACVRLADQYIADRFLPDKAIDILDETGACSKLRSDDFEGGDEGKMPVIAEEQVTDIISRRTGIPVSRVSTNESARLLNLEGILHARVIGQDEAVVAVSKAVRRARSGLKDPNRPVASFIFAGPTGVGKTELCKALSNTYYGNEKSMLRFDMSEYMEKHTVSKLIGSPPGYVGFDDESQLCDRIRRNPYSLVVFDEIEKAHPDIFNIMLQILEDGRLTDSKGRVVSFKNALIVMTSNVGAQKIESSIEGGGGFGFSVPDGNKDETTYENLKKVLMEELKSRFRPEFINRLDDTIVFRPLVREEVGQIAELEFKKVFKRVEEQYQSEVKLTERFREKVLEEGFDPKFGARPLRRAVSRLVEDELAASTLDEPFKPGDVLTLDVDVDGRVIVTRSRDMVKARLEEVFPTPQ